MPSVICGGNLSRVPTKFELFKLLRVIGEDTVQSIIPVEVTVPDCPTRLVSAEVNTAHETFHLFTNKVVKQGLIVIKAALGKDECECKVFTATVPFFATLDIPGVCPGKEVDIQFKNILIEHDLQVDNGVLSGKVHLIELVKVSEFVQRFLCTTQSPAVIHPKAVKNAAAKNAVVSKCIC